MDGEGAGTDLISRSVARGASQPGIPLQDHRATPAAPGIRSATPSSRTNGRVDAAPELSANHDDAALIHEAAIGKIAGEQILKLRTLGLTEEEAEAKIVGGVL